MALTLLLGGARSGKSAMALRRARADGGDPVFIATGSPSDAEMQKRIELHREQRAGQGWTTVEEPLDLAAAIRRAPPDACVVIDCLSLWVANLRERGDSGEEIARLAVTTAGCVAARCAPTIAVSNEVGMGVVPASASGRRYRDDLGRVNAVWAETADEVLLVVAGRALRLEEAGAR